MLFSIVSPYIINVSYIFQIYRLAGNKIPDNIINNITFKFGFYLNIFIIIVLRGILSVIPNITDPAGNLYSLRRDRHSNRMESLSTGAG